MAATKEATQKKQSHNDGTKKLENKSTSGIINSYLIFYNVAQVIG